MPLIKPRTRGKQFVRLVTRLERKRNETPYGMRTSSENLPSACSVGSSTRCR